jgi:dihydroorotase
MMDRRRFSTLAAGALVAGRFQVPATGYDLIIRGGRVIDPSTGLDGIRDVAVRAGTIVAVDATVDGTPTETIDAGGKLVTPGLIDIHTHAGREPAAAGLLLRDGVTSFIDAGSAGADNIDPIAANVRAAPQVGGLLLHIARMGNVTAGELHDIGAANVAVARGAIVRNLDVAVGIKVRLSASVAGANDLEALRRCQEVAEPLGIPIMVHIGQNYSPVRTILALMKRGDIITHPYAPGTNSILDDSGRLEPEVMSARRRGIAFDFGHGVTGHFDWDMVDRASRQGFWPDTISTDWNINSSTTVVGDLPNVMSKLLMMGMPLPDVIAAVTTNAARLFPIFENRGTLNVGAPADVTVMELRDGEYPFVDNYDGTRMGSRKLFPFATVAGGRVIGRDG